MLLLLFVLVCVLLCAGAAPSHPCYCTHCHGRGCGGWCRWCQ